MNLNDGTHKTYRKPNDITTYVHKESNHPPNIIKQLPIAIEKRISYLSSSKEIFEESKTYYQDALNKCGYNYELTYKLENNRTYEIRGKETSYGSTLHIVKMLLQKLPLISWI